ncbi:MAG: hypothetical protein Q7T01_03740 [bacterium]|nr:hypothetical protein [bacterium]
MQVSPNSADRFTTPVGRAVELVVQVTHNGAPQPNVMTTFECQVQDMAVLGQGGTQPGVVYTQQEGFARCSVTPTQQAEGRTFQIRARIIGAGAGGGTAMLDTWFTITVEGQMAQVGGGGNVVEIPVVYVPQQATCQQFPRFVFRRIN